MQLLTRLQTAVAHGVALVPASVFLDTKIAAGPVRYSGRQCYNGPSGPAVAAAACAAGRTVAAIFRADATPLFGRRELSLEVLFYADTPDTPSALFWPQAPCGRVGYRPTALDDVEADLLGLAKFFLVVKPRYAAKILAVAHNAALLGETMEAIKKDAEQTREAEALLLPLLVSGKWGVA